MLDGPEAIGPESVITTRPLGRNEKLLSKEAHDMPLRTHATHEFLVQAPADTVFMFFTPAGEELWVNGWRPRYIFPADGSTQEGMVFVTGEGEQSTIWTLIQFDVASRHSRYVRCTPASRVGLVEIRCFQASEKATRVEVAYTLTAITPVGENDLPGFEGAAFSAMIEEWREAIEGRLSELKAAKIR